MLFTSFVMIALITLVGAATPGPDFLIVSTNSLKHSRQAGFYTAVGVALGIGVHLAYCLAGIGLLIAESPALFSLIEYSGAAYLMYIGLSGLLSKPTLEDVSLPEKTKTNLDPLLALKNGFLTNILNPKATLFFLSIFAQVVEPALPFRILLLFSFEIVLITLGWFCLLAILLSNKNFRTHLNKVQTHIERTMGGLLLLFGLKIAMI
jgi:RhtB (resistance to homoserine/threonine) family protein